MLSKKNQVDIIGFLSEKKNELFQPPFLLLGHKFIKETRIKIYRFSDRKTRIIFA